MPTTDIVTLRSNPSLLQRTADRIRQPNFYWVVAAAFLISSVQRGPDFEQYLDWSRAAVYGDIFQLDSFVESPQRVPFFQWCAGPGLVSATLVAICDAIPSGLIARHGVFLTSALLSLVFWWSFAKLLSAISGGHRNRVLDALCAAFLGTHLGYYSITTGSELLALAPVAVLAVELVRPMRNRFASVVLVGSCTAILIMIRPYLGLYALPSLTVTVYRLWTEPRIPVRVLYGSVLVFAVASSCVQVGQVNFWMTGSWTHSPYVFGDQHFRSLDLLAPEILAVLFHPLHGWFIYHPLYALGLAAAVLLVGTAPNLRERILWAAVIAIVCFHALIQAAWYCWWLAADWSFGMRGMTPAGIPAIAAIIRLSSQSPARGDLARLTSNTKLESFRSRIGLLVRAATLICCIWSWLLMLQGTSAYYSYAALLESQWSSIRATVLSSRLPTIGFAGVVAALSLGMVSPPNREVRSRATQSIQRSAYQLAGILPPALALDFLLWGWIENGWGLVQYTVLVGAVGVLVLRSDRWRIERVGASFAPAAAVVSLLLLTVMLCWFVRIATVTQDHIHSRVAPPVPFRWKADFQVPAAQGHYQELLLLPGRESRKHNLYRFLEPYGPRIDGRSLTPNTAKR